MIFCQRVRSFPRERRITCMVRVLPPLTTCPAFALSTAARTSATGFTPGCHQNCRSSNCTKAVAKRLGTVSAGGKRHWPSSAMRAPSSSPSALSTTVEYTVPLNSCRGRQKSQPSSSAPASPKSTSRAPKCHFWCTRALKSASRARKRPFWCSGGIAYRITTAVPASVEAFRAGSYMASHTTAGIT